MNNLFNTALMLLFVGVGHSASAVMLDEIPIATGGDPTGVWVADSLEVDVYATPLLRSAISDLVLSGFVDGQNSFDGTLAYRSRYLVNFDVSLTFLGGPLTISIRDTVSESGTFRAVDHSLILTANGVSDTLEYSVSGDSLQLIQEVPLGEFSTLAASIDPDGGSPLAVLHLVRVASTARSADFDGNGSVDFSDFLSFASQFGTRSEEAGFDERFDLDADGSVGFTDFLAFVIQFG
jgi:hypothetical protein